MHRFTGSIQIPFDDWLGVKDATPEEIESLAFRLEGKLETMGMYRMYDEHGEVHTWIKPEQPKALVSDPDRIEAVILAAGKMGGEG